MYHGLIVYRTKLRVRLVLARRVGLSTSLSIYATCGKHCDHEVDSMRHMLDMLASVIAITVSRKLFEFGGHLSRVMTSFERTGIKSRRRFKFATSAGSERLLDLGDACARRGRPGWSPEFLFHLECLRDKSTLCISSHIWSDLQSSHIKQECVSR